MRPDRKIDGNHAEKQTRDDEDDSDDNYNRHTLSYFVYMVLQYSLIV